MKIQEKADVCYSREWTRPAMAEDAPEQHRLVFGSRGFTLLELLVVVGVLGILIAIAMPNYDDYKSMARVSRAKTEIRQLDSVISVYVIDHAVLPNQISDLPLLGAAFNDPWSHPYRYYNIVADKPAGSTRCKDIDATTYLNDDYDLYSVGKDGATTNSLSDPTSQDDIVRVNNGSTVDLGSKRGE